MTEPTNDRAYIHEFIDIRGAHRANYMHHMAANWSPGAQEDRDQLLYGMWAVLGSTGSWPQVCNIWEEPGLDGLARSFAGEATGAGLQDPKLERWWNKAAEFRRGGFDRILLPAPWMPTITESLDAGVRATVFAHEILRCTPGSAPDLLELARTTAGPAYEPYQWRLVGAWTTAMRDDDEIILLWALPDWQAWAAGEAAQRHDEGLTGWRMAARSTSTDWQRILLAAAPLCPFRTGRQPNRDDQIDWED
ncbi:MAG: NIPSNAP family containing protein [Acidimicrobiales bacterium]